MLVFPNCKINLGLSVVSKRSDGYHDIETVFYPVNWCDALEVIASDDTAQPFAWSQSGLHIDGDASGNLVYKAWKLIAAERALPPLKAHLHKNIPMGAGLGGGSSDAAFFINLLNARFSLGYTVSEKQALASQLGSDCAFFIDNRPVFASGRGNEFSPVQADLSRYYIALVYPAIHSNTRAAYEGLTPKPAAHSVAKVVQQEPVSRWKELLVNDFEAAIFAKHPSVKALKDDLYKAGAVYASMSGSGSAVFGLFEHEPGLKLDARYTAYVQKPGVQIL